MATASLAPHRRSEQSLRWLLGLARAALSWVFISINTMLPFSRWPEIPASGRMLLVAASVLSAGTGFVLLLGRRRRARPKLDAHMRANPDVIDRLASATMEALLALVHDIPGTTEDEQDAMAPVVIGEILSRMLVFDAAALAPLVNAALAQHKLAWRLVPVS